MMTRYLGRHCFRKPKETCKSHRFIDSRLWCKRRAPCPFAETNDICSERSFNQIVDTWISFYQIAIFFLVCFIIGLLEDSLDVS